MPSPPYKPFSAQQVPVSVPGRSVGAVSTSSIVSSVFRRVGDVLAEIGDYAASQISNDSDVTGVTVKDALSALKAAIEGAVAGSVVSVFGRSGIVSAMDGDYSADQVDNDSAVAGSSVADALNTLLAALAGAGAVSSVFGRTGAITAQNGDYNATNVGLGNVTNDAQLKRAAGDYASFAHKTTPVGSDIISIEDSAAGGAKKYSTLTEVLSLAAGSVSSVFGRTGAVVAQNGDYTPTQVGLGNVTNDAQLKRSANDWSAITGKSTPVGTDKLLIEDQAASGAKKTVTIASLGLATSGFVPYSPYLAKPSSADAWNLEASEMTDPDLANNGWLITGLLSPWTVFTRAGDIDMTANPGSNTYRSSIRGGVLLIQLPLNVPVVVSKAVTTAAFTYAFSAWCTDGFPSVASVADCGLADGNHRDNTGTRTYYIGNEAANQMEFLLVGPSTFTAYTNTALEENMWDFIRYVHNPAAGNVMSASMIHPYTGRHLTPSRTSTGRTPDRTVTITPTHAVMWFLHVNRTLIHFRFARRYPLYTLAPG